MERHAGFVALRFQLVPGASGSPLQVAGTTGGGFLCAVVALRLRRGAGTLERVDATTRERIFALRQEGRPLRVIAPVLLDEGHRPPYGARCRRAW